MDNLKSEDTVTADRNSFISPKGNSKFTIQYDMAPTIIYNKYSYTYEGMIKCANSKQDSLIGDYLGTASGSLSEKDETKNLLASCVVTGDVYSVKGYNKEFRICVFDEESSSLLFYENLNTDKLTIGKDLYGELHLKNNYSCLSYQLHNDYMSTKNNYEPCTTLTQTDIDTFIDALYTSPFVTLTADEEIQKLPDFDTQGVKIGHLYFKMNDETTVEITLYENGYILYKNMCRTYVFIDNAIFDKVFEAITTD